MRNGNQNLYLAALGILATAGQPAKDKSSFGVHTNVEILDYV